ncbi:type III secretion system inner membrane ring lipoprotein SctJ [Burkholderia pyrrocinia]|uniref:type III secretion system inner membrane ring lipoprotein SctJ n=1 Tax=Burkholderia pyrrocinia TaxID=60550 RepID=UPI001FB66153|nr:type III secretion inner membrane ring lipoprotein SctJ [Burkholderia pyrrocinia]
MFSLAAVLLAGCGKAALYDRLDETDANDMLSALGKAGIVAEKTRLSSDSWKVITASSDVSAALEVLGSAGLPRERFKSIGDLFPKEGLVSTPLAEHMRAVYAVQQELSRTISRIDGVIDTRVHLNIPQKESPLRKVPPPTASVFVKYRSEANLPQSVLAIKELVVGAVPGLTLSNVTVSLFPWSPQVVTEASVEYTQVLGVSVAPRSYTALMWLVFLPWALLGLLVAVLLVFTWHMLDRGLIGFRQGLSEGWRRLGWGRRGAREDGNDDPI